MPHVNRVSSHQAIKHSSSIGKMNQRADWKHIIIGTFLPIQGRES